MRRHFVSLIIASVLALVSSAAAGQSPTASPEATAQPPSTVWTFPERGIAIALPDGWEVTELEVFGLPWALTAVDAPVHCEVVDWTEFESLSQPAVRIESLDDWLTVSLAHWGP